MNTITTNFSYTTLETWTETPILPKPPFSYRRLSTSLWVFDTYNVPYIVV